MGKREIDKNVENQRENLLSTGFEKGESIRKGNDSAHLSQNPLSRPS
jgi:hypothetical protein